VVRENRYEQNFESFIAKDKRTKQSFGSDSRKPFVFDKRESGQPNQIPCTYSPDANKQKTSWLTQDMCMTAKAGLCI